MYVTRDHVEAYSRDGFLLFENVFSEREVTVLLDAIVAGERVAAAARRLSDAGGKKAELSIWFELGSDVWAAASTAPCIVNNARILLGEEISFFHGKVMLKEPHSGGAWEWHQDYGYWYEHDQFVFPRLLSVFVALDPATHENGCLEVLRGSHRLGRLDHEIIGDQRAVDPERLRKLEPLFERVQCEMAPGSALFFDCNLLHGSGPNESDKPRRSFIICFSALANPRLNRERSLEERPCPVSADDAVLTYGERARALAAEAR